MAIQELDVQMRVYLGPPLVRLPNGGINTAVGANFIDLTEPPYDLEVGAVAEAATAWKRKTVDNPHVEGSYTVHAERENSTIPVNVWVEDPDRDTVQARVNDLTNALSQLEFLIYYRVGLAEQIWTCEVSDYTVDTQQAYLHASMALVKAQVVRRPKVVYL